MQPGLLGRIQGVLESTRFQNFIIILIVINAITLGLETSDRVMAVAGPVLQAFDQIVLAIFAIEVLVKLIVYRLNFHKDPWNIFDLLVVTVALVPSTGGLAVLRSLRILRVLRLVSAVPSMRRIVGALLAAVPGISSIVGLLMLVFYVFSVMATNLFGQAFPDWFGNIGESAYTLFQVMTLESWSMGIVRPVMDVYPLAWLFFVPFILLTSFTVLNLFIGIVVDAMQRQHTADEEAVLDSNFEEGHRERNEIMDELRSLRAEVSRLSDSLPKPGTPASKANQ
ncbi:MAG: ion transporter [Burkholderiaceae bacterium]